MLATELVGRSRNIVVWGSAEYLSKHFASFVLASKCDYMISEGAIPDGLPTTLMVLRTVEEVKSLDDPLVIVACASVRELVEMSTILREAGIVHDHLSFYATRELAPRYLKAMGRFDYTDLYGNRITISEDTSDRVKVWVGQVGVCSDNVFEMGNVDVSDRLSLLAVGSGGRIAIGDGTTFISGSIVVNSDGAIRIGEDCMLARDVELNQSDQHHIFDLGTRMRINVSRDIVIGSHVWVGVVAFCWAVRRLVMDQ